MKVFISWSGEQSKQIASVFKDWIPSVIQAVKPYFSSSDIDKGARWSNEIALELEESKFGLICLTKENLTAPWLMFEAGALSKSLDGSRVCPMLFGVTAADLAGPLVQFQGAPFSKDEVYKVLQTINSQLGELSLAEKLLESIFEKWWPDLDVKINAILSTTPKNIEKDIRSERELLEEVLKIARSLKYEDRIDRFGSKISSISLETIEIILRDTYDITLHLINKSSDYNLLKKLDKNFGRITRALNEFIPYELRNIHEARYEKINELIQIRVNELTNDLPADYMIEPFR